MTANSSLSSLQIGGGGSTELTLGSNIDVDGHLTIQNLATLAAGSHTIALAGNWDDVGAGFLEGTSTVILDGTAQTVDETVQKM